MPHCVQTRHPSSLSDRAFRPAPALHLCRLVVSRPARCRSQAWEAKSRRLWLSGCERRTHASAVPFAPTSLLWSAHSTPAPIATYAHTPVTHPHTTNGNHTSPPQPPLRPSVRARCIGLRYADGWALPPTRASGTRASGPQPLRSHPHPTVPSPSLRRAARAGLRSQRARAMHPRAHRCCRLYATELAYLLLESASAAAFGTNFFL